MDFVLAILPWPVVMGLNMKRKEKITIACGLSLGVFAGACSIVRTVELRTLSSKENYVYDTAPMLLWSSSEICLTIICACIPVLRPLYVRLAYGSRGDSSGGASGSGSGYKSRGFPLSSFAPGKKASVGSRVFSGTGPAALRNSVKLSSDNASEETILRECCRYGVSERGDEHTQDDKMQHDKMADERTQHDRPLDPEMGFPRPPAPPVLRKNDIRVTTTVEVEENVGEKFVV